MYQLATCSHSKIHTVAPQGLMGQGPSWPDPNYHNAIHDKDKRTRQIPLIWAKGHILDECTHQPEQAIQVS